MGFVEVAGGRGEVERGVPSALVLAKRDWLMQKPVALWKRAEGTPLSTSSQLYR